MIGWVAARGSLLSMPGCCSLSCSSGKFRIRWPSRLYRDDFAKAGIQFLPVIEPDGDSTNRQIISHCAALFAVSLLPTLLGLAGAIYFVAAFVLGRFSGSGISLP